MAGRWGVCRGGSAGHVRGAWCRFERNVVPGPTRIKMAQAIGQISNIAPSASRQLLVKVKGDFSES